MNIYFIFNIVTCWVIVDVVILDESPQVSRRRHQQVSTDTGGGNKGGSMQHKHRWWQLQQQHSFDIGGGGGDGGAHVIEMEKGKLVGFVYRCSQKSLEERGRDTDTDDVEW